MAINCIVIEDEYIIRLHLTRMLRNHNVNVLAQVDTQEQAIEAVLTYEPDIVFVDVQLKHGGSGIDVVNHCKSKVKSQFIFMTAYSDETLDAIKQLDCECLIKPFEKETLLTYIPS